ncbi:MAG: allantoinase AllB [Pirellulales bacterium]
MVTPHGVGPAVVVIDGEHIVAVCSVVDTKERFPITDMADLVISPGVIDSHVHVNEPGRTEWEGFATATRAAAAGGVTTLIDMPLNSSPVTTTVAAMRAKQEAARAQCYVDVGLYGGLIPGTAQHIDALIDAGVCGIKAFLCDSGLDEFPASAEHNLRQVLPTLAARRIPLLVHAELQGAPVVMLANATSYRQYEASRPRDWERAAIELLISLCREYQAPIHIVHLANAESLDLIRAARREGLPLTVETCPHYLHFAAEEIPDGDTRFKCAPPIRSERDRERLWNALAERVIDTIGSDHSPCPPIMKSLETNDFGEAWGGIASLQLTLSTVWTGARQRGLGVERLAEWLSANPAKLVGLASHKGCIVSGFDADLVVWDPDARWTVRCEALHHRHKLTPYDGQQLWGTVERTYVRGQLAYAGGGHSMEPVGRLLMRPE